MGKTGKLALMPPRGEGRVRGRIPIFSHLRGARGDFELSERSIQEDSRRHVHFKVVQYKWEMIRKILKEYIRSRGDGRAFLYYDFSRGRIRMLIPSSTLLRL